MAFRRLSPGELAARGFAPTARRYVDTQTGGTISYRSFRRIYEASEQYQPLDIATLAKRRRQQANYNRLVSQKHARLQAQALAKLDTSKMGLVEASKAERETLRGVGKAQLERDPQFRSDVQKIKRFSHLQKKGELTKEQMDEFKDVLERLGLRDNIPRGVDVGDSEFFRGGLMRRQRNGHYTMIKRSEPRNSLRRKKG